MTDAESFNIYLGQANEASNKKKEVAARKEECRKHKKKEKWRRPQLRSGKRSGVSCRWTILPFRCET